MRRYFQYGLTALAFLLAAGSAEAQTSIDCGANPNALQQTITANPAGAFIEITGFCNGNFQIFPTGPGFIIGNHTGSNTVSATDGIIGQVDLVGAGITFNGITFTGNSTDQAGVFANLVIESGGRVLVENCTVHNSQRIGIVVQHGGSATLQNTTVTGNGLALVHDFMDGIVADQGGAILLGAPDSNNNPIAGLAATVTGNNGRGLVAVEASSIRMFGGSVTNNGLKANAAPEELVQALVVAASSIRLVGVTVTAQANTATYAALAAQSSTLRLENGTSVSGSAGGALIVDSSHLFLVDSTVSSTANNSTTGMAVQVSIGSSIDSQGNNTITNTTENGVALQVDHGSNFHQFNGTFLGNAPAGDTINGLGIALTQSTMDLGTGATAPSTWNGTVVIQGNSSLRMSGGMTVTGQVLLKQGSNAAFNLFNGGSNAVNGGVTCPATAGDPDGHVAGPTLVTPNVTVGTNFTNTTPPTCLAF